jgi:dsRNA-specific ribonuclease
MFEMAVLIDGVEKARAVASTKKRAEMEAAKQALNQMTRQDAKDEA